ncbi:MAG: DNA-directed RNA polymerase subunit A' [Candidatus Bathyarchaeota archaeon]|nr:MAG: DNA-directed RNA polymerase subunit A' [Candidatus Bathyarchaeota archaeon]
MSKVIDAIKFGVLPPDEIRRLSVVEIMTSDTYDEDGGPISGGLMDQRLGTLEPRQRCRTCGNISINCPGHYGHIELAVTVIHVEFAKHIYKLLSTTCRSCGRVLLTPEEYEEYRRVREEEAELFGKVSDDTTKEIIKSAKKYKKFKECPRCGMIQSNVKFAKPTSFFEIEQEELDTEDESLMEEISRRLTPNMIREWFERIPDEDMELLNFDPGVARPEWMILQVLPVPPVDVRPSIILESGIRAEDDLTHKLVDIIRINQRLKENIDAGAPTLIIEDLSELLQYHVTTYFNNEVSGIPPARHRSGRTLKSLAQRLKGKEGRFRGNLSGKRVDYSARTVISPDPNLDINEVGVPVHIAIRLTVPDIVTERNIEEMRRLVRNGPYKHPGALYIIRPDNKRIRLEFVTDKEVMADSLEPGFIIERHLKEGDIALFNRQPSLHRMSIMAHRVKVLPYRTFRMHLAVCPPYNADFDGDEMNLHVPQSKEAQTEARLLMQVQDQILSPRYGAPIIGATKDFITGAYLLTREQTMLTADDVGKLLAATGYEGADPEPAVTDPQPLWSGKDIFSLYLPNDFNFVTRANVCHHCPTCDREACQYDSYVIIREGRLMTGVIDKNSIGAERAETIFHRIIKDYGTDAGHDFLNSITHLINEFLSLKGFTFSIDELTIGHNERKEIGRVMKRMEKNVDKLIEDLGTGQLERLPGQSLRETFEIQVMNELAKARDKAGETVESGLEMNNSGIIMTRSGARGSSLNIGQMMGSVGQQAIRGKRIMRGYMNRTLPHFNKHDPTPEARGFVYNCYRDGLNPIEFFFHSMGGREGLVDTAVRTQQSGYMQRRLINALEHLRVEYDGTVRDSSGDIVQFTYGEDGVDPAKSDHGKAVDVGLLIERVKIAMVAGSAASEEYIEERLRENAGTLTPSLVSELRRSLAASEMTEEGVDVVIRTVVRNYDFSLVEPGEAVGTIAAQSIGEPGTQMTLRTFHYAGVAELNVTLGLPRLIELVDARRSPSTPVMNIYLNSKHRRSKAKAREVAERLTYTVIDDVIDKVNVNLREDAVKFILNPKLMEDLNVTTKDVERALPVEYTKVKKYTFLVSFSEDKAGDPDRLIDLITKTPIRGIPEIKRVLTTYENGEWVIRTDGSNLEGVLGIEGVNPTRTTTNDIHEIAKILGIEAARNALISEAHSVLEEQGLDVDIRHVMLVSDIMTNSGEIEQIGRHGISGKKSSVLARAAFELTIQHLVNAAIKGETDPLKGVIENIIVGQSMPLGTGCVELFMSMGGKRDE